MATKKKTLDLMGRASSSPGEELKRDIEHLRSERKQREVISPAAFERETISNVSFERETISPKTRANKMRSKTVTREMAVEPEAFKKETISSVNFEKEVPRSRLRGQEDALFEKDIFKSRDKTTKKRRPSSIKDFKIYRQFSDRKKSNMNDSDSAKGDGGKSPISTMFRRDGKAKRKRETASWFVLRFFLELS